MAIFLDHAATSPLREVARDALLQGLAQVGNPSSVHSHGQHTREILEQARDQIAKAVSCDRSEVIFTSGGTEANNAAIKGLFWARTELDPTRRVIVSAATEHHAVIDPIQWLVDNAGAEQIQLPVLASGEFDLEALADIVRERGEEIALISLMWVNNETGVIAQMQRIGEIASSRGIPVHTDAVAALGHIPLDFAGSGLTAMSLSGHKVGAPIGVGALIVSRSAKPTSLLHGGGQERGLRSGTMNYPLAASFAAAARESQQDMAGRQERLGKLRDQIELAITKSVPEVSLTAASAHRVEHNAHLIFPGANSDNLLFLLDQRGISVSAGSACQAGVLGPSHVLLGMGYSEKLASCCLRITLGHNTTEAEVDKAIEAIREIYPLAMAASAK